MRVFETGEEIPRVFVDAEVDAPDAFVTDPFGYFEREGVNIKKGEVRFDETGKTREDPTATKDLPNWLTAEGQSIPVVGKLVNTEKGEVAETNDPLHEFNVLALVHKAGLPAARALGHAESGGKLLLIMEKLEGVRIVNAGGLLADIKKEYGYTDEDIKELQAQAGRMMATLKEKFEAAGIHRGWALKDMVLQINFANKRVMSMVPVDWERTKIIEKI